MSDQRASQQYALTYDGGCPAVLVVELLLAPFLAAYLMLGLTSVGFDLEIWMPIASVASLLIIVARAATVTTFFY